MKPNKNNRAFVGAYLNPEFTNLIDKAHIKTIVEVGSRDCLDAIELAEYYEDSEVLCFECNPETISQCFINLQMSPFEIRSRINFFPFGVGSKTETRFFYKWKDKRNPGASSFLSRKGDAHNQEQTVEKIQIKRLVDILSEHGVKKIDLLCLDIQGFELEALRGLGNLLQEVKFIITEIPKGESLYEAPNEKEIMTFFHQNNFKALKSTRENLYEDNILLVRSDR